MSFRELASKCGSRFRRILAETALPDGIMAFSTACLLLVGVIAAGISYFQWHEMHMGGVDTHDLAQAAKVQADATKAEADSMKELATRALRQAEATDRLAVQAEKSAAASIQSARDANVSARATKEMADTSAESLENAKESAHLDQRAWLAMTSLRLTRFQPDKKLEAQIIFTNSGRSPALRVSIIGTVLLLDGKTEPSILPLAPPEDFTQLRAIAPQSGNTWTQTSTKLLTAEEKEEVGKGSRTIWAWGFVRYEDTFGIAHVTQFCGNTRVKGIETTPVQEGMDLNLCPNQNGMN